MFRAFLPQLVAREVNAATPELDPPRMPTRNEPGSAARNVPNGTYGPNGTIAMIAQTKYGAPPGWSTPVGQKGEGFAWTKPDGSVVFGSAPGIFRRG